jgi:iron complex transport system substrate-binding protein
MATEPHLPRDGRGRRQELLNALGAASSLALSVLFATWGSERVAAAPRATVDTASDVRPELRNGREVLVDATGVGVPIGRYERIASASSLADPVLLALIEPGRVLAFSSRTQRRSPEAQRYAGKPGIDTAHELEPLLMLKPDLVLLNGLGNHDKVQRLRDAGLTVFDLGPMRGVGTLVPSIQAIGWLVGEPERGRSFAARFVRRLRAVAASVRPDERKRALYVGTHGKSLYGGTRGSSFGDVLHYAGLEDVAGREFSGWPSYSPEQLLLLDPELIVTQTGMAGTLCRHTELGRLRACRPGGQVVEVDDAVISDPGLGMLDAAEQIAQAAYGDAAASGAEVTGSADATAAGEP